MADYTIHIMNEYTGYMRTFDFESIFYLEPVFDKMCSILTEDQGFDTEDAIEITFKGINNIEETFAFDTMDVFRAEIYDFLDM